MKKILYVVLVLGLLTLIPLTGCGKDNTADIKAAADGFMSAMQAGDIEAAKEYCDPALFEEGGALSSYSQLENIDTQFAAALGVDANTLSDKAKTELQEFVDKLLQSMVKSYEIGNVTEPEEGVGKAELSAVFGFDPEKAKDVDINSEMEQMMNDYMASNMAALTELYASGGQQAITNKVVDDLLGDILDKYVDAVLATGEMTQDTVLTIENKDGKWLVTDEDVTQ